MLWCFQTYPNGETNNHQDLSETEGNMFKVMDIFIVKIPIENFHHLPCWTSLLYKFEFLDQNMFSRYSIKSHLDPLKLF